MESSNYTFEVTIAVKNDLRPFTLTHDELVEQFRDFFLTSKGSEFLGDGGHVLEARVVEL